MTPKRVKLHRTAKEWDVVDQKVKESGKSNITSFIRSEVNKITSKYNECPLCVTVAEGQKLERTYFISPQSYDVLKQIAIKMRKPVASVIDDFIIAPLLMP